MRLLLGVVGTLLLTSALAGCFDRTTDLTVELEVRPTGAIQDFRSVNLTLRDVRLDPRTLNPITFTSEVSRLELVQTARTGSVEVFHQEVRADRYETVTLTTPPGARFQGVLLTGERVDVVVPNNALRLQTDFDLPRGGAETFVFTIEVAKTQSGTGQPTYFLRAAPEASGLA